MGACGSSNNKRDRKDNNKKSSVTIEDQKDKIKVAAKVNNDFVQTEINKLCIKIVVEDETEINAESDGKETLSQFLGTFNVNLRGDLDIILQNGNNLNDETETNLKDLIISQFSCKIPDKIQINIKYKGLLIPKDIKKAYIENNPIIGNPIFDNPDLFGIITYNREKGLLTPYIFDPNENEDLTQFNSFTAYCNAYGRLYLSGGEKEEQTMDPDKEKKKYNNFFYIDLKEVEDDKKIIKIHELPNLEESKAWHSMIFVPNKYIFIVGGSDSKSVLIYDINEDTVKKDSELNEERSECSLCLVNDTYLYCFYGFLLYSGYIKSIERCNLRKEKREWDYVICKENSIEPELSFFGVSYFGEDEILLIGGNDNKEQNNRSYILKLPMEDNNTFEIKEFKNQNNIIGVFREKLFIPVGKNLGANIPLVTGEEYQLFAINTETGIIEIQKKECNLTTEGNLL